MKGERSVKRLMAAACALSLGSTVMWGAACSSSSGGGVGSTAGEGGTPPESPDGGFDARSDGAPAPECSGDRQACVACCDEAVAYVDCIDACP
jgi:hypothetical protein